MDARLNIYISDLRKMLDTSGEEELAKALLSDSVLSVGEAIDCYREQDIQEWLKENAYYYGYKKEEDI